MFESIENKISKSLIITRCKILKKKYIIFFSLKKQRNGVIIPLETKNTNFFSLSKNI